MNKVPHIITVFISKSQITRCCWLEDKLVQGVRQTYSSEPVCINTEYSRELQEELWASHMTRYTSSQGLINIFNFSLLFYLRQDFAKLGCGNVSTTGFQFLLKVAKYNHESTISLTVLCSAM